MSNKTEIRLKHPIEAHGETIDVLTLRRPKLKDLKGINLEAVDGDALIKIVSALAGIPPSAAGEIDAEDLAQLGKVFEGFFPGTTTVGK